MLTSNLVQPSSRVMFVRNVEERVRKAAPFLAYDASPYPVVVNGQIDYVVDAYTTTAGYPYAEQALVSALSSPGPSGSVSGLDARFNYVRNSVTVVVNAYSGRMTFYVVDPDDPIVRTYEHAYPGLFSPRTSMPDALKAQLRYPEDLFTVQAAMLGRYHVSTAAGFYASANVWASSEAVGTGPVTYPAGGVGSVAGGRRPKAGSGGVTSAHGTTTILPGVPASARGATTRRSGAPATARRGVPTTSEGGGPATAGSGGSIIGASQAQPMTPTYQVSQLPQDPSPTFNIMTPLLSASEDGSGSLTGLLVARSTPSAYGGGKLEIYATPPGGVYAGPSQVSAQIYQDQVVASKINELTTQGETVLLGTIQAVPVGQSLLWVRPMYASSGPALAPRLVEVIVAYGTATAMEPTFAEALADVLGQTVPRLGSAPGMPGLLPVGSNIPSSARALVAEADFALGTAQGELRQGDLSAYQADVEQAQVLLGRAERNLSSASPPGVPGPRSGEAGGGTTATTSTGSA